MNSVRTSKRRQDFDRCESLSRRQSLEANISTLHLRDTDVESVAGTLKHLDDDAHKIQQDAEDLEWMRELDARMCDQQW